MHPIHLPLFSRVFKKASPELAPDSLESTTLRQGPFMGPSLLGLLKSASHSLLGQARTKMSPWGVPVV